MKFPAIDYCILCEDVRVESNGKGIILGFYGVLPHVQITLLDRTTSPFRFMAVVSFDKSESKPIKIKGQITNPDGSELSTSKEVTVKFSPTNRLNLVLRFAPLTFKQDGAHTIVIMSGEEPIYRNSFHMTQKSEIAD